MKKVPPHFKLCTLAALLATSLTLHAQVLPAGMSVVAGQAQAALNGKQLTITNTNNTILNWQSFSIGAGASVNFVQPSSTSKVLNQVTGSDPSSIFGTLSSNGQVWLLNPNGVLFGQGARVDVASLVTSTLNTSDSDWLAGRNLLTGNSSATVENQGEISSALGGRVALVGNSVSNSGTITTDGGQIILAAGQSVELVDTGAPNLAVKVTAPTGSVVNLGSLNAAGGRIDVMAAAVNQQGIVEADSLGTGPAGQIVLQATDRLTLTGGSRTHADGQLGGNIELLGNQIDLQNGSAVSASGALGGGTVLVGGGAQGQDASVPDADAVYFAPGADIAADATQDGNGGHIVLWSNSATRAFGSLSATGGANGGNGGLIETSGGWLAAQPTALNLAAPKGEAGTWLLDPYNITITDGGADSNYNASFTATGNDAVISSNTIQTALNAGSNVTISTSGATPAGTQAGTITLSNVNINVYSSAAVTLTLNADSDIIASNTNIASSYEPLNLYFHAGLSGRGGVSLSDVNFNTTGGSVTMQGTGSSSSLPDGVLLSQAYIESSDGVITLNGSSVAAGGRGVALDAGLTGTYLNAGAITLNGSSTAGDGVQINDGTVQASGLLTITGNGGQRGVAIVVRDPNTNPIELSGMNVVINGTSTGTGYGLQLDASAGQGDNSVPVLQATGAGAITLSGSNQAGGNPALSILGANDMSDQWDTLGSLTLSATGGGMLVSGISAASNPASISATSDAALTLQNLTLNPVGAVTLQGATVALDGVDVYTFGASNIAITSAGDLSVNNSTLLATNSSFPLPVSLSAGTGGTGSLSLSYTTVSTMGGNITLSNGGTTVGGSGAGVSLVGMTLQPDTGTVQINGQANGSGAGILLDVGTSANAITAGVITLVGNSTTGTGVQINNGQLTTHSGSIAITGSGGSNGVVLSYANTNDAVELNGNSGLTLTGTSTGTGYGVLASETAGSSANPMLTSVADLDITGSNTAGGAPAVAVNAYSASGDILSLIGNLNVEATGGGLTLSNVSQSGQIDNLTLSSSSTLNMANTTMGTIGGVTLEGQNLTLTGSTSIYAQTGLLVAGPGGTVAAQSFSNQAGASVFSVISGYSRWIIWLQDATQAADLTLDGLAYDFTRYGATSSSAWADDVGNGIVSAATETAVISGSVASRVYDGTTNVSVSGVTLTPGVSGDVASGLSYGSASFSSPNAGGAVPVTLNNLIAPSFIDSLGKPVYGYTLQDTLSGDITPALLTASVSVPTKVYDGTTSVSLSVGALSGLIGNETVNVDGTGTFNDKNVGNAKPVTTSYQLSDGTNGGLASNYIFQGNGALTGDITPATLGLSVGSVSKSYDGTTAVIGGTAAVSSGTLFGTDSLSGGSFAYTDKNVGSGDKTVTVGGVTVNDGDGGSDYTVSYVNNTTSTITPANLSVSVGSVSKSYDGTTAVIGGTAAVSSGTLFGTDSLSGGSFAYTDKNVGSGDKTVTVGGVTVNDGDGGSDYTVSYVNNTTSTITPATLSYVAQPAQVTTGAPLPAFTGSVSGFVGGDTLSSATTGTLAFYASTSSTAVVGSYAIDGSGLDAANYQFAQAVGNATALTVFGVGPAQLQAQSSTVPIGQTQAVLATPQPSDPSSAGLVDLTPPLPTTAVGAQASFDSAPLSSMSSASVADMLGARAGFMQNLLGKGLTELQQNPGLADVAPCKSLKEATTGTCLVTEALKLAARGETVKAPPVLPGPTLVAPATVAAAPARPIAVAPAPLPPPVALAPLFGTRSVKQAALPEIRRKMAVLIGEGRYSDTSIPALKNADGDAHALAALLEQKLGYETLVLDNPSKEQVIGTLNRLALETRPQDSVVIYYAGHGALADSGGEGYWIMSNSNAQQPRSWLSNADIARLISQIDARQLALISDSCYSGSLVGRERIRGLPGTPDPAAMLARRGAVVMSSGGNEPVFDSGRDGHSLFAWALMNNLRQVSSWQPGGNLFERVRFAVARELPQRPQYGAAPGYQEGADYLFEVRELDPPPPAKSAAASTAQAATLAWR